MGDLRGESKKRTRYKGWREGDGEEKGPRKIDTLNRFAGGRAARKTSSTAHKRAPAENIYRH